MASVKKNYIYQVSYEVLAILLPLITAPYITRTLGADNLGIYSYGISIVNIFLSVARLGVVSHGSRSIAAVQKERERRSITFWSIYSIQAFMAVITLLAYILYAIFFISENREIALLLSLQVVSSILDIGWMYMGVEEFRKTVLRNTIVKVLSLILIFSFVHERTDLLKYAIVMCSCIIVGHLSLWFGFRKYIAFVRPKIKDVLQQVKPMLVLFIPTIAVTIYTIMDKVMLGLISGTTEVAYYEYASAIVSIPLGFITSFGAVMLPRMSALVADGSSENTRINITNNSLIFMSFMSCAFTFGLSAISHDLIPVYYGIEFLPCISLLILLSMKLPFMAWANAIRTQCLIPNHKDKEYIISLFVGAIVNLLINLVLIPLLGAVGAAIGTIVAEAAVCFTQTGMSYKMLSVFKTALNSAGFIVVGIIMFLIVRFVSSVWTNNQIILIIVEVVSGAFVYLFFSFLYYCIFIGRCSPKKAISMLYHLKK